MKYLSSQNISFGTQRKHVLQLAEFVPCSVTLIYLWNIIFQCTWNSIFYCVISNTYILNVSAEQAEIPRAMEKDFKSECFQRNIWIWLSSWWWCLARVMNDHTNNRRHVAIEFDCYYCSAADCDYDDILGGKDKHREILRKIQHKMVSQSNAVSAIEETEPTPARLIVSLDLFPN